LKIKIGKWYYPKSATDEAYVLDAVRSIANNILLLNNARIMFLNDSDYIMIDRKTKDHIDLGITFNKEETDLKRVLGEQRYNNHVAIISVFNAND
jgi:hypothetical protein